MAVKIGNVWDSTTHVLTGRAGLLAPVAALAFFLPAAAQAAIAAWGGKSPGAAALGALLSAVALVAALWGQLTVVAVASDPDVTRAAAVNHARRRLGAALLVTLVIAAIFVIALLPIVAALALGGFDFRGAFGGTNSGAAPVGAGTGVFLTLYGLALVIGGLWLGARLFLISPVVLHERRGIGAIARSMALTRGLTLKLIGAALLLLVVYGVAATAAQFVTFIVFRLVLGPAQLATATWLGALAAAAIGATFSVVVAAFTARLYVALVPRAPFPPG